MIASATGSATIATPSFGRVSNRAQFMMRGIRPVPRSAGQTADLPKQKGGPGLKRRAPSVVFFVP